MEFIEQIERSCYDGLFNQKEVAETASFQIHLPQDARVST